MDQLKQYLNGLKDPAKRATFLLATGTTLGYLRKVISQKKRMGIDLCIRIEVASLGRVRCEDLRPDVDWAMYRKFAVQAQELAQPPVVAGLQAINPIAEPCALETAQEVS